MWLNGISPMFRMVLGRDEIVINIWQLCVPNRERESPAGHHSNAPSAPRSVPVSKKRDDIEDSYSLSHQVTFPKKIRN